MASPNNPAPGTGSAGTLPKIVVISGTTATGKTGLAIALAQRFGGEVINADSRYLYRGFDIGVAKPTIQERLGVPHHLIDILPPDGEMSLARYQDLANAAIEDVLSRHRLPILVGGTPLYINAVVEGWRIPRVAPNPRLREALAAEAEEQGNEALERRLREVDPVSADRCAGNLRRIIRALEVYLESGQPMSEQEGKGPRPYDALEIGLFRERQALYAAIDERINRMIEQGLVDEVRTLLASGVPESAPAMASIGYRQLLPFLAGGESLETGIAAIAADTRRYVRHQETWLRRNSRLIRIDSGQPGWIDRAVELVTAIAGD
jgi:tRNA dimethylallyltransferase